MTRTIMDDLESTIKDSKESLDLAAALERLSLNKDFKLLVQEGYLKAHALELVYSLASADKQTPEAQAAIMNSLRSVGELQQYLRNIILQAGIGEKTLADAEKLRDNLLANG